jgi:hypothetical protein
MFETLRKKYLKEKKDDKTLNEKEEHFEDYTKGLTKDTTLEDLEKKKKQQEEFRKKRSLW